MQNLKFSAVILCVCLLYACAGNSSAPLVKDNTPNNTTQINNDSTYYGKNSVAYSINGRHVAIKDQLKLGEGRYILALFVNSVKNDADGGMVKIEFTNSFTHEVFKFFVSNKGTTTVTNGKPTVANIVNKKATEATYMGSDYINYYAASVVVNVTAIDATHITGTFSGKFATDDNSKPAIEIKDGSFDFLFTKGADQ